MRAQLFAEFHEKVREADSRISGLQQEILSLKLENEALKAAAGSSTASVSNSTDYKGSLLVAVSSSDKDMLKATLSGPDNGVVMDTFISNASAKIYVINLVCVRSGEWLNSETINVYVQMIEAAAKHAGHNVTSFNSYFVSKIESEVVFTCCFLHFLMQLHFEMIFVDLTFFCF